MNGTIRMILVAAAILPGVVAAKVATGAVFGSHMVLQRGVAVPVFGTAASGETVSVGFNGQTKSVTASGSGTWSAKLDAMAAGGPFTMTIKGGSGNTLTYSDVMVGEVWHCAGQSNMDTRLNYSEYSFADSIKTANYQNLRYITMRQPNQTIQWQQVNPASAASMTATGYFFGRHLLDNLKGVAVGIVNTSVGGTVIKTWMDPATVAATSDLKNDADAGSMYSSFVKPVEGIAVKGTVYLQGENDAASSALAPAYNRRLEALIKGWRKAWNQPDMPFLIAGLCHKGALQTGIENSNQAIVRESQRTVTDTMPNTWLSVMVDLGSATTWHYPMKPQTGRRLGLLARGALYGQAGFVYESPRPVQCFRRGTDVVVVFDSRGSSLKLSSGSVPTGFSLASGTGAYSWARGAALKGDTVFLTTSVANPTQVRFAWGSQPIMNLFDAAGLPATPFQMTIASAPVGVRERFAPRRVQLSADRLRFPLEGNAVVRVRSLDGRLEREHPATGRDGMAEMDVRGLRSGAHLLEVVPPNGDAMRDRFAIGR